MPTRASTEAYKERFCRSVRRGDSCWQWTGRMTRDGYGAFWFWGRMTKAHRVAWALENGSIPDGLCVLHQCDNRACVNPGHLFLGTQADNQRDMIQKGRSRKARGERHGRARLTESDVQEIRGLLGDGMTLRAVAARFGVSVTTIHDLKTGKTWAWLKEATA